jgi:hypothetical protein
MPVLLQGTLTSPTVVSVVEVPEISVVVAVVVTLAVVQGCTVLVAPPFSPPSVAVADGRHSQFSPTQHGSLSHSDALCQAPPFFENRQSRTLYVAGFSPPLSITSHHNITALSPHHPHAHCSFKSMYTYAPYIPGQIRGPTVQDTETQSGGGGGSWVSKSVGKSKISRGAGGCAVFVLFCTGWGFLEVVV